MDVYQ